MIYGSPTVCLLFVMCRMTLSRCKALYKIGHSHYRMGNSQHALHYYDQALGLCEEEFTQLLSDIKVCEDKSMCAIRVVYRLWFRA